MGLGGEAPEILQHLSSEFLLNHHRNIVIVLISLKFGGGGNTVGEGGGNCPQALMVA